MRLIDADMLIEDLETEATNLIMEGYRGTHRGLELTIPSVIERINEMPTVDITPIASAFITWLDSVASEFGITFTDLS